MKRFLFPSMMSVVLIFTLLNIITQFGDLNSYNLYPFFNWKLIPVACEHDPHDPNFTEFSQIVVVRFRLQEKVNGEWTYLDCENRKCLMLSRMLYNAKPKHEVVKWIPTAYELTGDSVRILRQRATPKEIIEGQSPTFSKTVHQFKVEI